MFIPRFGQRVPRPPSYPLSQSNCNRKSIPITFVPKGEGATVALERKSTPASAVERGEIENKIHSLEWQIRWDEKELKEIEENREEVENSIKIAQESVDDGKEMLYKIKLDKRRELDHVASAGENIKGISENLFPSSPEKVQENYDEASIEMLEKQGAINPLPDPKVPVSVPGRTVFISLGGIGRVAYAVLNSVYEGVTMRTVREVKRIEAKFAPEIRSWEETIKKREADMEQRKKMRDEKKEEKNSIQKRLSKNQEDLKRLNLELKQRQEEVQ